MAISLCSLNMFLFIIVLAVVLNFHEVNGQLSTPVPKACQSTHVFDTITMKCKPCRENSKPDGSGRDCVCSSEYVVSKDFGGDQVICQQCATSAESNEGIYCLPCTDATCAACGSKIISGKTCIQTCAKNFMDSAGNPSRKQCVRCENVFRKREPVDTCPCGSPYISTDDGYCVLYSGGEVSYQVFLTKSEKRDSRYLERNLKASQALCKTFSNSKRCEELTNLCSATYASGNMSPCKLYANGTNLQNWPGNMPWMYYSAKADSLLNDKDIPTKFSLKKDSIDNLLRIYVAVYTINGTYLGLHSVRNGRLQICRDTLQKLNSAWSFSTFYYQKCDMNVYDLMSQETLFFDPYIEYSTSTGNELYPIPVLITNYQSQTDDTPNTSTDKKDWVLVRRFFLVDNALFPGGNRPEVFRYARNMELNIELVTSGEGLIHTPYIKIDYDYRLDSDLNANSTVSITFSVNYVLNSAKFGSDFQITVAVLGVLGGLFAILQTNTWIRRSGALSFILWVLKFLVCACGNVADAFLLALISLSIWWLSFFKTQDVVYLLPVTNEQEAMFRDFLILAFALKVLDIIHLFIKQVKVDIFLMDWERPKAVHRNTQSGSGDNVREASVSVWRTYFVANEWNEIQTSRKISPLFQIIITLLLLQVAGFENLCTKDRSSNFVIDKDSYSAPQSYMFRFGIMSALWICVAFLQWIFFTLIWERFIEDKVRQFVDLCSMANVSVFIMENAQFGYYIHGRSPHGIADTGMKEMSFHLKRETENLCARRGLVPSTDAQTFRISLPIQLRNKYDEIFRTLNDKKRQITQRRMAHAYDRFTMYNSNLPQANPAFWQNQSKSVTTRTSSSAADDKMVQNIEAHITINKHLSDFIDHSLKDVDYIVKDKMFFESLLDTEFERVVDKGYFYNDNGHSFDKVLFYGHELTLTTFEILLFGFVDIVFMQGFVLSAVITYFVGLFFQLLRDGLGRRNLAEKTLVDERFLI